MTEEGKEGGEYLRTFCCSFALEINFKCVMTAGLFDAWVKGTVCAERGRGGCLSLSTEIRTSSYCVRQAGILE